MGVMRAVERGKGVRLTMPKKMVTGKKRMAGMAMRIERNPDTARPRKISTYELMCGSLSTCFLVTCEAAMREERASLRRWIQPRAHKSRGRPG
jgi:organic hydroperoxide reductase OsmC/OhrA